jgi:ParB/RepB/Spo0J family partition protein
MPDRLEDIPPERIERNDENPRMYFRDEGINRLAESVEESGGVLVPVYVFKDPEKEDHYKLIDGERRWRVALRLGLDTIPAHVRETPPDPAKNIVEMFNIHKVREDWEDMPTARALRNVMERNGTEDADELKRLTGLSKEQISRFRLILELPEAYQKMIEAGDVPMNFFVELDRNVIRPLARSRKELAESFDEEALLKAFVEKREHGALPTLIDLRKVKPIIQRAETDAGAPDQPSALDAFLRKLFEERETTIDEVYDASVAFAVEADKVTEQAQALPEQFKRLLGAAGSPEERAAVLAVVEETRDLLSALLTEHAEG